MLVVAFTAASALAQEVAVPSGFALERLRLTAARDGLLDTEWGSVPRGPGVSWDVGLWLGYERNPLLFRGPTGDRRGALLEDRVGGSVVAAVTVLERLQLGVELPVVLVNERPTSVPGAVVGTLSSVSGAGVGDLRVTPKVALLRHDTHGVDLAVLASFNLPTGGAARYIGSSGVVIQPELALSRPFGNLRAALDLGAALRTEQPAALDLVVDHELQARLGLAWRFNQLDASKLPLELGVTSLAGFSLTRPFQNANQSPLELKAYGSYEPLAWLQVFAAAGVGVGRGWGVPDWRALAGVRFFSPPPKVAPTAPVEAAPPPALPADTDGDGLDDAHDRCPRQAGPRELDGCADVDTDGDGLVDRLDRCPAQAEDADGFEDRDGCPDPDNDGDGVLDGADACVNERGVVENRGCPDVDTDGDGLVDRLDNCPGEAGPKDNAGCKKKQLVVLEAGRVFLLGKIEFKTNSAVIEARSEPILADAARVLAQHPELTRVRVEGHTDAVGDDAKNLTLSQARAESVKAWLARHGVAAERLVPVGYGETRPLTTNDTSAGRSRNRRVEFTIIDPEKAP